MTWSRATSFDGHPRLLGSHLCRDAPVGLPVRTPHQGLGRQRLYAFKNRKHYEEQANALLPDRYIRETLIEEQWDEILRLIATIRLKVATASQLFRRLNSYSRQHPCTKP